MADMYDAILVKNQLRYRLNKVFIAKDKVPENIRKQLTADNIIDDNGLEIVSQKNDEAKQPEATEDNRLQRRDDDQSPSDVEPADEGEDGPTEPATEEDEALQIDDSANQNQNEEGDGDGNSTTTTTPKDTTAPVAQTTQDQPEEPDPETPSEPVKKKVSKGSERTTTASEPVERFRSKVPQSQQGMGFPRKNGKTVDIFDLKTPHTHTKLVGGHAVPLSAESYKTRSEADIIRKLHELGFELIDFNRMEADQARDGVADQGLLDEDDEEEDITTA